MNHYPTRPGTVIAAAVLLFLYGGLMLICSVCGALDAVAGNQDMRAFMDKELPATEFISIIQVCSNLVIGVGMITMGGACQSGFDPARCWMSSTKLSARMGS